jgi:hypothetical protein
MSTAQMKELAEKRKRKKIITKVGSTPVLFTCRLYPLNLFVYCLYLQTFPNVPAMMSIDYEKRGSPGAVKRQVHRQLFA